MMSYEQALSFKLRNGSPLKDASRQEWHEEIDFLRNELDRYDSLDATTMTDDDRANLRASKARLREFLDAMEVVLNHHKQHRSKA
jgi:hypothetical protein